MRGLTLAVAAAVLLSACGEQTVPEPTVFRLVSSRTSSHEVAAQDLVIDTYRDKVQVTRDGDVTTLKNTLTGETSTHIGLARIRFVDRYTSFDLEAGDAQVFRLYRAAFKRLPDPEGLGFWIDAARKGMPLASIADAFQSSAEFAQLYGRSVDHAGFVRLLYTNVLHRDIDAAGLAWWIKQLEDGSDRNAVLLGFSESSENRSATLPYMQHGFDYAPYAPNGPILPQKTSYLNAKNLDIPAQRIPTYLGVQGENGYGEGATGGVAFADFLHNGEMTLVTFTNRWAANPARPQAGAVHFYRYVNGEPVDVTSSLLTDMTGCVAPRRLLVADFNSDGRPDIFASCHGPEYGPYLSWPGERPRLLLSQSDGRYSNVEAPIKCYCHGAAAADINGDGNVDILVSDMNRAYAGKSSYVVLSGNGLGKFSVIEGTGFILPEADYADYDRRYYTGSLNVFLHDFNGDGKVDLFLANGESHLPSFILAGDGRGNFRELHKRFPLSTAAENDYHFNDIVVSGGYLYLYANLNTHNYRNQVRKYDLKTDGYTVIHQGASDFEAYRDDFIFMMPFKNELVPYDARFGVGIGM